MKCARERCPNELEEHPTVVYLHQASGRRMCPACARRINDAAGGEVVARREVEHPATLDTPGGVTLDGGDS